MDKQAKAWRDFARQVWAAKCDQNRHLEPPIIYIAPKVERKNGRKA